MYDEPEYLDKTKLLDTLMDKMGDHEVIALSLLLELGPFVGNLVATYLQTETYKRFQRKNLVDPASYDEKEEKYTMDLYERIRAEYSMSEEEFIARKKKAENDLLFPNQMN